MGDNFIARTLTASAAEFNPYLGIFGGYSSLRESPTGNKDGFTLGGKGVGSFKTSHLYLDGALGYEYERLSGSPTNVETSEMFFELDPKYRLSNSWSLGPVAVMHFGTDTHRSESEDVDRGMVTGGLKVMYEDISNSAPYRIELSLRKSLTDLNAGDYYTALLGFQIGFPWSKDPERKKETPATLVVPALVTKKEIVDKKPDLVIKMQNSTIGFNVGKSDLNSSSKQGLMNLGKHLSMNKDKFSEIKIGGHTDSRGSNEYNQKLSEKRAEVV